MNITLEIFSIIFSYLLGSIPVGYILTKAYTGKNILKLGSGNVGSTNVGRIAGKKLSIATQILDILKGLLPVALFILFEKDNKITTSPFLIYELALAAIIGHDFSIFLKFKGGKGVNTTLGASLFIAPLSILISVFIFLVVKWWFKYVSLGSIILGISLPITYLIFNRLSPTFYYLLICSVLIILMHKKNIIRLMKGKEML